MIDTMWDDYGIISMKMTYEEFMEEGELSSDNRYNIHERICSFMNSDTPSNALEVEQQCPY